MSGFDLVADEVRLDERLEGADLVITGEGFLDEQSFEGKVVGGVAALAERLGVPVVAIAGQVYDTRRDRIEAVSLVERFGEGRARATRSRASRGSPPTSSAARGTAGSTGAACPRASPSGTLGSMVERIRRAGTVCWAVCGVAALIALLGLIVYVFRVIWPPLILAGAIVFLLNPVVTRLQGRHIPRALGTGLSYLAVVAITVLVGPARRAAGHPPVRRPGRGVARAARGPGGRRQRPVGALGGGRVADPDPHLAGARGPVLRLRMPPTPTATAW